MVRFKCPVHNQTDCSPILNGCSIVILLHAAYRDGYDEGHDIGYDEGYNISRLDEGYEL